MPEIARTGAAESAKRAWARVRGIIFPAAIVLIYVYSFPYFEGIRSANELPRIYLTMALVDRGAVNIDPELHRFQPTPDTSSFKGKLYCNKAPGMSLLTVPIYAVQKFFNGGVTPDLARMFFWFRLFGATLPSLLFLLLLWRFLGALIPDRHTRRIALSAYALGTMALVYGTILVAHQLSALLIGAGFILLFLRGRGEGSRLWPALAGLAAGASVLVDYQSAFIGPPLFIYAIVRGRPRLRTALHFAIGAAIPLGVLLLYHQACFESPFLTGYNFPSNPTFAKWHSQGFLGLKTFKFGVFARRYFSSDDGLFYYSPFLLLAVPGIVQMFRQRALRAEAWLCAFVIVFFAYFIGAVTFISGWDVGPRYITCALPFFIAPVAVWLSRLDRRHYRARIVPYGLIAASVVIYAGVNAVFPHYPDNFSNPLYDVTFRFARAGYFPYNLGWLFGLKGLASALPYLGVVLTLLVALLLGPRALFGKRAVAFLGAVVFSAVLLTGYYVHLNWRPRPVPVGFLPWMERIWEPRHEKMALPKLTAPLGPRGNR